MTIQQLSVFLENRAGQLSAVTELLAQNHVDMQALNIAETADYGVLRLIVDMPQRAARLLRENGFIVRETPVVQAPVSDKPGGLNAVLSSIAAADIDIEYMYSGMSQKNGLAYMIFRVADAELLRAVLTANGLDAVAGEELGVH